jgi:solute carrier family 25 iron transporter 28/37
MWQTIRYLVNQPASSSLVASSSTTRTTTASTTAEAAAAATNTTAAKVAGLSRLWVGVETIMVGCIPAHALYFSSYELVKSTLTHDVDPVTGQLQPTPLTSSLAGAAAVFSHDFIMTPLDTIKQRMQLGHYNGSLRTAVQHIYQYEGAGAFFRSFPVTVVSNIPYGMIMVSTHEMCKQAWTDPDIPAWQTVLAASAAGGCVAAALTTPLDRIKTALQTQQLAPACGRTVTACPVVATAQHKTWYDAARTIARAEGVAGFFRGAIPRVLSHTPAVAISWTTYESLKSYLLNITQ